jgi:acetyl-CoA synthetase
MATEEGTLERQLEDLLEQERFEPPEDFVRDALVTDLSMHE